MRTCLTCGGPMEEGRIHRCTFDEQRFRRPVGFHLHGDATGSIMVTICDDGSVWVQSKIHDQRKKWTESVPIPGSRRAHELEDDA